MKILVDLLPPSARGALYPRYVRQPGVLALESPVPRPWYYGVNIHGLVAFDLDADRVLANVDLMAKKGRWNLTVRLPKRLVELGGLRETDRRISSRGVPDSFDSARLCVVRRASLQFRPETLEQGSIELPLRLRSDPDHTQILIQFGEPTEESFWVALSEQCLAWIDGECLIGFFVDLGSDTD